MTFTRWMAARTLLYDEFIGKYLRAGDNAKSSEYSRSVAHLKRAGLNEVT